MRYSLFMYHSWQHLRLISKGAKVIYRDLNLLRKNRICKVCFYKCKMDSEDDDILPEARVFCNRAEEVLKARDEEYAKLCMKMEEEDAKPDVTELDIPDETDKEMLPKLTRKRKGGRMKSQEKDVAVVIDSLEPETNRRTRHTKRPKKTRNHKKSQMQWFSETTPSSPQNSLRITITRRLKTTKPVDDLHIENVLDKSNSDIQPVDVDDLDDIICDDDDDEEDYQRDLLLKVRYISEISKIKVKEKEKFASIFERVANLFNLKASEILLCLNDRNILVDDTPRSLNLGILDIIDCIPYKPQAGKEVADNLNRIHIRIQASDGKKTDMHVHKLEKMQDFMERYAEKFGTAVKNLIFEFDGEKINGSSTPGDLEIEDGSCIDVKIISDDDNIQTRAKGRKSPRKNASSGRTRRTVPSRSSARSRGISPTSSNSVPVIDIETEILPSEMLQIVELD